MNIDFGYTDTKYNPLNRRNSIALLLGAGFSVPKGYPTANQLNKQFVEFDKFNTYFLQMVYYTKERRKPFLMNTKNNLNYAKN